MECGAYVFVVEHARLVRPPAAALLVAERGLHLDSGALCPEPDPADPASTMRFCEAE